MSFLQIYHSNSASYLPSTSSLQCSVAELAHSKLLLMHNCIRHKLICVQSHRTINTRENKPSSTPNHFLYSTKSHRMSPVWHRTCTEHRKQSILCLLSKHNQFTAKAVTTALLCSTKSHQISPVQCRTDTECMLQHRIHAKQMRFGAKAHHQTSPKYTEAHHQTSPK